MTNTNKATLKVMPIIGIRPQMIKSAPILHRLNHDKDIQLQLIHSGQHYDFEMSRVFFNEFDLPDPAHNLNVGSGSHAVQTARLMRRTETIVNELKPDVVMVFGDANTTLAGALAAIKLHVPVCHVEAGLRSYDMNMPEEVNRVLTDHCSQMLCAPTQEAVKNLQMEGLPQDTILSSGDTMYDAILQHEDDINKATILHELDLTQERYGVLTTHRPENVDNRERLTNIVTAVLELTELPTVFPIHPRTKKRLKKIKLLKQLRRASNVIIAEPLGYFDMLKLVKNAAILLTDSGGMQKEAFMLHVPCITLRYNTEWVETLKLGANKLVGAEHKLILRETRRMLHKRDLKTKLQSLPNPYGAGKAAHTIVDNIKERFFAAKLAIRSNSMIPKTP